MSVLSALWPASEMSTSRCRHFTPSEINNTLRKSGCIESKPAGESYGYFVTDTAAPVPLVSLWSHLRIVNDVEMILVWNSHRALESDRAAAFSQDVLHGNDVRATASNDGS